jgi:hypothetical protein
VAAGVEPEPILGQPRGLERRPPRRSVELVAAQHLRTPQSPEEDAVGLVVAQVMPELDRHESGHPDRPDLLGLRRGEHSPPRHWSGTWDSKIRGTVTRDGDGWVAYLRLEDPPGLSPITTVGWFATVDEAPLAADEVWASR